MYLRNFKLIAQATGGQSYDLSGLRVRFRLMQHNVLSPDKAIIKITNQNPTIAKQFVQNGAKNTTVSIYAGYQDEGTNALLFTGGLVQAIYGRENPTDTLTTLVCTAGIQAHTRAVVNKTHPAGSSAQDHFDTAATEMKKYGLSVGYVSPSLNLSSKTFPRPVTLFGMAHKVLGNIAKSNDATVTYNKGKIQMVKKGDAVPGQTVVLNSRTGMIGMPTQDIGGIMVRSLINSNINVGGLIQINQGSIQGYQIPTTAEGDLVPEQTQIAKTSADGIYQVYQIDYEGDTRGTPWYMDIACLTKQQYGETQKSIAASLDPGAQGGVNSAQQPGGAH